MDFCEIANHFMKHKNKSAAFILSGFSFGIIYYVFIFPKSKNIYNTAQIKYQRTKSTLIFPQTNSNFHLKQKKIQNTKYTE